MLQVCNRLRWAVYLVCDVHGATTVQKLREDVPHPAGLLASMLADLAQRGAVALTPLRAALLSIDETPQATVRTSRRLRRRLGARYSSNYGRRRRCRCVGFILAGSYAYLPLYRYLP